MREDSDALDAIFRPELTKKGQAEIARRQAEARAKARDKADSDRKNAATKLLREYAYMSTLERERYVNKPENVKALQDASFLITKGASRDPVYAIRWGSRWVPEYSIQKGATLHYRDKENPDFNIAGPFSIPGLNTPNPSTYVVEEGKAAAQVPAAKKAEPAKKAQTDDEKRRAERQARIKKAEETHVYDAQYMKDKQEEEAERSGKTVAQVASESAKGGSSSGGGGGASSAGSASETEAASGLKKGTAQNRSAALYETQVLQEMAQNSPDPYIRMQAAAAARAQFGTYLQQKDEERYGMAGASQIRQASMPYNAANPMGYQAAPGSFAAPGPAAQVAENLARQKMEQARMESIRLQQLYGQGNAPDFLKPGTAANRAFQMLSPEQQVAAIRANNTQATPFNRQTPNAPNNYAELWRKAGFKPNEVPAAPAARFAPGYQWAPPGAAPAAPAPPPLPPTPVAPAFPQNPYGQTPMVANMMTTAPEMPMFPQMIPYPGQF